MKRRTFLKKTAVASGAAVVTPTVLANLPARGEMGPTVRDGLTWEARYNPAFNEYEYTATAEVRGEQWFFLERHYEDPAHDSRGDLEIPEMIRRHAADSFLRISRR